MKLRLLGLATCVISTSAIFAQLPNGDMETWSVYTSPVPPNITCDYPNGWDTPDKIGSDLGLTDHVTEKESSNVHGGALSAKMTTKHLLVIPPATFLDVPGTITTGVIGFDFVTFTPSVSGGAPVTSVIESFDGFFQYAPAGLDTMNIVVYMFSGSDTIGVGLFRSGATAGWEEFNCPITYFTADVPDVMQIIITSSGSFDSPAEGSVLYVDDMSVTGGINVEEWTSLGLKPNVFPNPATDHININNPASNDVLMEVYNLQGQRVDMLTLQPEMNGINLSAYASGIYTFRLLDNGVQVYGGKFKVAK